MNKRVQKILIANRGEIAVRIMRTCREMHIKAVAVYSEIDRNALHVKLADEAYLLGPAPASESYLNGDKIIQIAKKCQAHAIHPGYGFLSENPQFAEAVEQSGLIFVGPTADSMRKMGDKLAARRLAKSLGIPIVPGTSEPSDSLEQLESAAAKIGYPVLLKAAAGGGGKGMKRVASNSELPSAFRSAQSEARSAFGDDRVYIEKYLQNPRHIEVQVVADRYGDVVHLGERECSIQRRHQKIIEESPSIAIDQTIRDQLTQAAVSLVKESNYINAGTVEFLLDKYRNFYFLEMNTRLQVEHPVTEMRARVDLVREQINIAGGEILSFKQEDINLVGHAIECRIYAEDPENNFFPSTGVIRSLRFSGGANLREDRGIEQGSDISPYYDPLLSKLIAWGESREDSLSRISAALEQYELFGVKNNIGLCLRIVTHPDFTSGNFDTNFISESQVLNGLTDVPNEVLQVASVLAVLRSVESQLEIMNHPNGSTRNRWKSSRVQFHR